MISRLLNRGNHYDGNQEEEQMGDSKEEQDVLLYGIAPLRSLRR